MLVAFDTSLLVAALRESQCRGWLLRSVATFGPSRRGRSSRKRSRTSVPGLRLRPSVAHAVLTALLDQVELHPVSREAHVLAMARCARMGLVSGAIFDAVIMAAPEEANVDAIVTFNVTDFERFRAEGSPRVVLPPDPPGVAF